MKSLREQLAAEFIGTFALVFIGAGSVVLSGPSGSGTIGVAVAHGLVLAIMVSALGHISGGHFNPAVTVGVWVTGRIQSLRAGAYVVTQLVAAAAAAGLLRLTLTTTIWKSTNLGATLINATAKGPQVGFTSAKALMLEAVLTFFLVIAVFGTAIDPRGTFKAIAGFGIGLVLTVDILVGGVLTGASMNPARSFGPALVAGKWTDFWVYVLGPLAGAIIAAEVYWFFFLRGREAEDSDADALPGDEPFDDGSEMEPASLDS